MRSSTQLLALAASLSTASASAIQGMNVGSTNTAGVVRDQANFQTYFSTAKNLAGTNNAFTSFRLYTTIQGGTTNSPISAIPAAIAEGTHLLLGMWCSGDSSTFNNELIALKSAITTYGDKLFNIVDGISVGSEDLYRDSPTGIAAGSDVGQKVDVLLDYINQVKTAVSGTAMKGKVGHVDTWTAWVNGSNAEIINAVDWLGFDGYPYWQTTDDNVIANGKSLFLDSYDKVTAVAGNKEVWVTETGWAVSDAKGGEGLSVASADNAKKYWDDVGCGVLFGQTNTWWYMLNDFGASPSFGVTNADDNTTPLYNLTCPAVSKDVSSSSSSSGSATTGVVSPSSSISTELAQISQSASSALASLSSVAATATGSAKSSILAEQTSVQSAASVAASSLASKAATATTSKTGSGSSTSSSPASSSSKSAAVANAVSVGGVFAAALAAAWVL